MATRFSPSLLLVPLALCSGPAFGSIDVTLDRNRGVIKAALAMYESDHGRFPRGRAAWQSDGTNQGELRLGPDELFGTGIKVGDLAAMSWYTSKSTPGSRDFFMEVWTVPFAGGDSADYGHRLTIDGAAPGVPRDTPADTWNQYSTDGGAVNRPRVFDAARTPVGFAGAPTWDAFLGGPLDWGLYAGSGSTAVIDYANEQVQYVTLVFGRNFTPNFVVGVDALSFRLTNGSVTNVDLEVVPEPATGALAVGGALGILLLLHPRRVHRVAVLADGASCRLSARRPDLES